MRRQDVPGFCSLHVIRRQRGTYCITGRGPGTPESRCCRDDEKAEGEEEEESWKMRTGRAQRQGAVAANLDTESPQAGQLHPVLMDLRPGPARPSTGVGGGRGLLVPRRVSAAAGACSSLDGCRRRPGPSRPSSGVGGGRGLLVPQRVSAMGL